MINKLNKIYNKSKKIVITKKDKIIIISDCHRGSGNNHDNFKKNKLIYNYALNYYFKNNFTYIELGDGDDMWEEKNFKNIINENISSFKILKKFYNRNKLYMIYGNHDIYKKSKHILKNNFYKYYNKETNKEEDLLNNLLSYESLILSYNNNEIFLIHGHQVDLLNGTFIILARFLVRNIWMHLENIGIKDPTSAAKNNKIAKNVEKRLNNWSKIHNKILISGHTHRPIFPKIGDSLYFNDGSCIHPNGITCIEIENGYITLVKWEYILKENKYISIERKVLEGKENIDNFFIKTDKKKL